MYLGSIGSKHGTRQLFLARTLTKLRYEKTKSLSFDISNNEPLLKDDSTKGSKALDIIYSMRMEGGSQSVKFKNASCNKI